jgi:hypothetical protein
MQNPDREKLARIASSRAGAAGQDRAAGGGGPAAYGGRTPCRGDDPHSLRLREAFRARRGEHCGAQVATSVVAAEAHGSGEGSSLAAAGAVSQSLSVVDRLDSEQKRRLTQARRQEEQER